MSKKNKGYKKSYSKMTPEELAMWLHVNRKAHAVDSAKAYNRKQKHKGKDVD